MPHTELLGLLFFVVIVGVVCWLVTLIPSAGPFPQIAIGVGVVIVIIACLHVLFGIDFLAMARSVVH